MKKSKKHLKDLARLASYLKKEAARLEKIASRAAQSEASPLIAEVLQRLALRRDVAMNDLGLVSAAEAAVRKADKANKAPNKTAKPAKTRTAKATAKKAAPAKKAPAKKAVAKKTAAKKAPAKSPRGRKPKVAAPAQS